MWAEVIADFLPGLAHLGLEDVCDQWHAYAASQHRGRSEVEKLRIHPPQPLPAFVFFLTSSTVPAPFCTQAVIWPFVTFYTDVSMSI